jgi:hypothetical protein
VRSSKGGREQASRLQPGFVRGFLVGALLLLPAGYGIARATQPAQHDAVASSAVPARSSVRSAPVTSCSPGQRENAAAPIATEQHTPRTEPDALERYGAHASQVLIGDFRRRIQVERNRLDAMAGDHPVAPELVANTLQPYLTGWIDAVRRAAPELAPQLQIDVGEALCAKETSDEELIALGRITAAMPAILDSSSIDCVLASRPKEDIVVWTMLDAWTQSGMARTEQVEALAQRATDPRTLERLKPPEQRAKETAALEQSAPMDLRAYDELSR